MMEVVEIGAESLIKNEANTSLATMETTTSAVDTQVQPLLESASISAEAVPALTQIQETPEEHSDAVSIIEDFNLFSDERFRDKLANVGISFTCKICKAEKPSLRDLMHHLENDNCTLPPNKRRPGRPRKYPRIPGVKKPDAPTAYVKQVQEKPQILESKTPGRRATRISTGSIKRRNAAELLGIKIESDDDGDDLDEDYPTPLSKQTNQLENGSENIEGNSVEIVLNIEHLIQAADQVKQEVGGEEKLQTWDVITENQTGSDGVGSNIAVVEGDQVALIQDGGEIIRNSVEDGLEPIDDTAKSNDIDMATAPIVQELVSKYKSTSMKRKVSLITCPKLNLIPVSSADNAGANKVQPVITIKSEEPGGNIVIPTSTSSGQSKNVIIPHSLLLQALKEHRDEPKSQAIIIIDNVMKVQSRQKQIVEKTELDVDEVTGEVDDDNDPDYKLVEEENDDYVIDDHDHDDDYNGRPGSLKPGVFKRGRPRKIFTNFRFQPLKCNICLVRVFRTSKELEIHQEMHLYTSDDIEKEIGKDAKNIKRNLFKCCKCAMEIPNWNRMLRHMLSHEIYREKLANTELVKNIFGNFPCPKCKKCFDMRLNMIQHWRQVHNSKIRTCSFCKKRWFCDSKTFTRHEDKCKNVLYQCEECSYRTKVQLNMNRHMRIHTGKGFKCEECSKVFPTKQRFNIHVERHNVSRTRYSCQVCSKLFLTIDALKKHFARFHMETSETFSCPKCPYVAKIATDIPKHDKLVHDKKYKCEQDDCAFMTNSEASYQQHNLYHKPDRKYPCQYTNCYYRGCTQKQLSDHCSTVHHMQSKHQCPICQKFFKKKTHLLRHLVSHTGDQPYKCVECGQSFYSHSTYYRHRNKMGHDAKREGVASIPQNIVITYVQEDGTEDSTVALRAKTGQQVWKPKTNYDEDAASLENLLLQSEEVYPPSMDSSIQMDNSHIQNLPIHEVVVDSANNDQVMFVETTEGQFVEDLDNLSQNLDMVQSMDQLPQDGIGHVTQRIHIPDEIIQEHVITGDLQPANSSVAIGATEVLENVITIPEGGDGSQYTYILSSEEAQNMISGGQVTLDLPDNVIAMESLPKQIGAELVDEGLYREGTTESIETVVEVTPSSGGDNRQYAILLVPSSTGNEPEAAMSMLQLQSSLQ